MSSTTTAPARDLGTIVATRAFFTALAIACNTDVAQIETALATLVALELDADTLDNFQTVQDDARRAAGRCRATIAVLDARHGQLEEAVNATPDPARADFYRGDPGRPAAAAFTAPPPRSAPPRPRSPRHRPVPPRRSRSTGCPASTGR